MVEGDDPILISGRISTVGGLLSKEPPFNYLLSCSRSWLLLKESFLTKNDFLVFPVGDRLFCSLMLCSFYLSVDPPGCNFNTLSYLVGDMLPEGRRPGKLFFFELLRLFMRGGRSAA